MCVYECVCVCVCARAGGEVRKKHCRLPSVPLDPVFCACACVCACVCRVGGGSTTSLLLAPKREALLVIQLLLRLLLQAEKMYSVVIYFIHVSFILFYCPPTGENRVTPA